MVRDDEPFIHFQECLSSLNRAWAVLGELVDSATSPVLRSAAYHMAIVEYAKPFKASFGSGGRKFVLPLPNLSDSDMRLHERLLALRDQTLAHSDLSIKDARVYVSEVGGRPFPLIVSNTSPQLPAPGTVRGLIERLLDALYLQIPAIEQQFKAGT